MATASRIPVSGDGTTSVPSEWFVARITGVGSSTTGSGSCVGYAHAWIEQQICANGYDYEDMPSSIARYGTIGATVSQPAFALDGSQSTVGAIVLMRPRSIGASDSTIFEFFKGGGSGNTMDCPHVSSVQCTGGLLVVTYDTTCVAP